VLCCSGFTSVAQYLDAKLSSAAGEAKVSLASVAIWCLMAAAMVVPLGGVDAYSDSLAILTDGGLEMGNLVFLWVAILTYYSAKVRPGHGF
jgi:fumarate reductase subunit D